MANALYDKFKEDCLEGVHTLSTDDIRFVLVDLADYTFSAAHEDLADVPAGARVAVTSAGVGSKAVTGGVFDAADITVGVVDVPGRAVVVTRACYDELQEERSR